MSRDYVPVDVDSLPEIFEFDIADRPYHLQFNYNEDYDFFTVDLYDREMNPIVMGEKLMLGRELWAGIVSDQIPTASLIPLDESGNAKTVCRENFMHTVFLYIDDVGGDENDEPNVV